MRIIKHRINTIEELRATPINLGVEIDVRSSASELIVSHDPFKGGVGLTSWLNYYNHDFLIVNVKEDGLEYAILDLLENFQIQHFFFLDQSIPSLYKSSKIFPEFCCSRVSDIEPVETVIQLNVNWIWFDSHSGNWDYLENTLDKLKRHTLKKCLVSPEIQRPDTGKEIKALQNLINKLDVDFDAVCTKFPEKWRQHERVLGF